MGRAIRLEHLKLQFLEAEEIKYEQFQMIQHNIVKYFISLLAMSFSLFFTILE